MFGKPIAGRLTEGGLRPNEMQISCKRLENTYGPLPPQGAPRFSGALASPRLSAAFAG